MNRLIEVFPWNEKFGTRIPQIDEQHRKLVHLLNMLASSLAIQADISTLNSMFNELAEYAVYHFQTEENVWHQFLAEDILESEHKKEHDSFVSDVLRLREEENSKPLNEVLEDALSFLTHWLAFHILESDMLMSRIVLALQSGKSLEQAKQQANQEMIGAIKATSGTILSMYGSLYSSTLQLMKKTLARDQDVLGMIENSPDTISRYDRECRRIYVNPAFGATVDGGVASLLGKKPSEYPGGLDLEIYETRIKEVFATGINSQLELKWFGRDGKEFCSHIQLTAERDMSGTVNTVLGVGRDITVLNNYQTELKRAGALLKESQLIAGLGNYILDIKTGMWESSDVLDSLFGIDGTFERSVGGWKSLIHPDDQAMMDDYFKKEVLGQGNQFDKEYRITRHNDKAVRWVSGKGKLEFDPQGYPIKMFGIIQDITDRKLDEEKIQYLAYYDQLTKLPNRRLLLDRLQQVIASQQRSGNEGALLLIDLDNFKTLNDTLGHATGDLLLQQVAGRLMSCVRGGDTIARLGGDEFVVLLEDLDEYIAGTAAQTETVGKKILATLNRPYMLGTHEYQSTHSIGVTIFKGFEHGMDELLKQADIAMYQAKKDGRNTLRFFDPQMQETINAHAALESELHLAIESQQFQLHYQIQVKDSGQPLGAEALIRWIHPERGLVTPAQFIPLAEENGEILTIGKWVLDTACAQLCAWQQDKLTRNLVLAVNVSAKQFRQSDFVAQVRAAVKRHAVNPKSLKLELTESLLLDDIEDTISTMSALKKTGVTFSLDDFGTGYSSLQYLKRLPLNQLKIDQSFVRDIATDSSDKAIVTTIIAMSKSLNFDVIAEGVETEEQRKFLKKNGCTQYQGYLFGKPVPVEKFEASLK